MGGWPLFFGVALIAAVIALLVDRNRRRHEEMYAQRMRRSAL